MPNTVLSIEYIFNRYLLNICINIWLSGWYRILGILRQGTTWVFTLTRDQIARETQTFFQIWFAPRDN